MRARLLVPALAALVMLPYEPAAALPRGPEPDPAADSPAHRAPSILDSNDRMSVNNLDMVVTNYGSFAFDAATGNAGLIYPKGSTSTVVFAAGLWVGAQVNGEIRVSVAEYAPEYVPGYMLNGTFVPDTPDFRNYTIERGNTTREDYLNWPVWQGAPLGPDGKPLLLGDVTTWSVYNDADPARHTVDAGRTAPLGIEVQQTTFAFNRTGPLGDAIFFKFKIFNKGGNTLDHAYLSIWSDPDLGGFTDDLVGCDTTLGLGYAYNATNADAQYGSTPPAVGFVILRGPVVSRGTGVSDTLRMTAFTKHINGTDPVAALESYRLMRGLHVDGSPLLVGDAPGGAVTTFAVSGDPVTGTGWIDTSPADRRMMVSMGPLRMIPGDSQEIIAAVVVGRGADRLASIQDLRDKTAVLHLVLTPPSQPDPEHVQVSIEPHIVNLAGRAPFVSVTIEPESFSADDIDTGTLRLAGSIPAEPKPVTVGDFDGDGRAELRAMFRQAPLRSSLGTGMHSLSVTGSTVDGISFQGADEVRVIDPPLGTGTLPIAILSPLGAAPVEMATPAAGEHHRVEVFDLHGRLLGSWESLPGADGRIVWDGRTSGGGRVSSGIYFVRVTAGASRGHVKIMIGR